MQTKNTAGFLSVVSALVGNTLVTALKFVGATLSGSSVMFSEAIHSLADTLNQVLLLIGVQRSQKKANDQFEYGYGNERFFWALISACGIFFVGAGVTVYRGIHALTNPEHITFGPIIIFVLLVSFAVELYTLRVAAKELKDISPSNSWGERLAHADPATLAVFLEDAVAVFGVLVAIVTLGLSYYTGNSVWDALGSIIIGCLLAVVAIVLIVKNRAYLLGQSMPEGLQEEIVKTLEKDPAVEKIIDFKSTSVGWGVYRIKFELEFNGGSLLRGAYQQSSMRDQYEEVQGDYEEFKKFSVEYADRIPRLMGKKIDEIEKQIKELYPSVRHIDIEIN